MIVADTSTLIDAWEPPPRMAGAEAQAHRARVREVVVRLMSRRRLIASAVSVAELLRRPNLSTARVAALEAMVDLLPSVLTVSRFAAEVGAWATRWRARRELPVPETTDALIIGVCLDHGMPLLTTAPRHFAGTPRLRVLGLDDVRLRAN